MRWTMSSMATPALREWGLGAAFAASSGATRAPTTARGCYRSRRQLGQIGPEVRLPDRLSPRFGVHGATSPVSGLTSGFPTWSVDARRWLSTFPGFSTGVLLGGGTPPGHFHFL